MNEKESQTVHKDLFNELKYLLCAAVAWSFYDELVSKKHMLDDKEFPPHFKVYAMDSAVLHARSLYEFFTRKKAKDEYYSYKDFGVKRLDTDFHQDYDGPMHIRLLHLKKQRSLGDSRMVNGVVIEIANDILELWVRFESELLRQGQDKESKIFLENRVKSLSEANNVNKTLELKFNVSCPNQLRNA